MTQVTMRWKNQPIRAVIRNNKCEVMVKDVLAALGYVDKKSQYDAKKCLRRHLKTYRFAGMGGSPAHVLEPQILIELLFPELRRQLCPGDIYCFAMKHKDNFYKFGRTRNWNVRRKQYQGCNEVGTIMMVIPVQNIRSAERKLLKFAHATMNLRIGNEYFESPVEIEWVRHNIQEFVENTIFCDGNEIDSLSRFLLELESSSRSVDS